MYFPAIIVIDQYGNPQLIPLVSDYSSLLPPVSTGNSPDPSPSHSLELRNHGMSFTDAQQVSVEPSERREAIEGNEEESGEGQE